ncbi:hypothetical protein HZH66_012622 [Vespula vulgaris]|uniref:Uncharacterized protein n=1 Tax=Vespula vulgaris TaxID=7454 RepID=A0A834JBY1_VESVU|nr:hypothetical protein HZH66_012622 [Vespula vulgaris]
MASLLTVPVRWNGKEVGGEEGGEILERWTGLVDGLVTREQVEKGKEEEEEEEEEIEVEEIEIEVEDVEGTCKG